MRIEPKYSFILQVGWLVTHKCNSDNALISTWKHLKKKKKTSNFVCLFVCLIIIKSCFLTVFPNSDSNYNWNEKILSACSPPDLTVHALLFPQCLQAYNSSCLLSCTLNVLTHLFILLVLEPLQSMMNHAWVLPMHV